MDVPRDGGITSGYGGRQRAARPSPKDVPPEMETPRNPPPVFRSFLQSCLNWNVRPRWPTRQLLQHRFLKKSKSLAKMAPLINAVRRPRTAAPEPLLAPSLSGQEGKEEQVDNEPVAVVGAAEAEEIKSILKSSAMAGVAAAPQPKENSLPDNEMPSTSTGKRGTGKKCTQKTNTGKKSSGETSTGRKSSDQPQLISSLTSIYLADLKGIVSEENPMKKYTLQQQIGQGAFGTVFRGVDIATGGQVAIKKIFLGDQKHQSEKVVNEVTVLKRMRHPNIIRYIDSYLFNDELWLVMEYVEGCTLGDVISKQALEEEMIASISRECLKALDFLHSNRVIHRDIKSDNILLGMDGSVRLIGFGSCVWLLRGQRKQTSVHGTPFYMAPEMLRRDRYDAKVDIWALGITALEMVDGSPEAQNKLPELESPRELSPVFHSFLHSCLNQKVKRRWTARKLLQHPFLEKSGSLTNMSPLLDAARRSRAERFTTPSTEPLLAPSVTGEDSKEEQVEKENVKAKPEEVKSILKSSAMAGAAAGPQPEEVTFANTEMPSTSTGKGDTRKKSIPKKSILKEIPHQPPTLSPLTQLFLAELKGIVSEENPAKKYTLQQQIGQGAFGTVFQGVDIATGGQVAIKKIFLRDRKNKRELVVTEVSLLSSMRHPNIIRYIDSYLFNDELWLVMEYVEGCTLAAVVSVQALEEEMIASISWECLKALDFLHSNRVIHRDIKSDNILLGMDGSVKLIDFGLCAWLKPWETKRRSFIGTPFYMAPEMLAGDKYDARVDIWALGITALEMVDGPTRPKHKPPQLKTRRNLSPVFHSFLQSCLKRNEKRRWTAEQLLKHPFLEKSGSLTNMRPLLDAVRRFLTERFTTPPTEPLLAPSVSGQESKEEQAEKENVKAKPEGMKSILKSSAMAAVAAAPQPEEVTFANTEMPSTSTGKGDTRKKSIPKKITDQPPKLSPLTRLFLAELKQYVSEENPTKKYTVQQIIGQGTFGTVFRGVDIATGGQVAIKKIFLGDQKHQSEKVVNEVTVLKRMRHPNIIHYIDSYLFNEELWLVMEYVEGCTLGDVISKQALEEEMIASISRECLKALDFLHSNRVIHRDIKSGNILLGMDGSVKLIDFGLCAWLKPWETKRRSFIGTPFYMAPEMLAGDKYDARVDIWALGITALEMVDGPTRPKDVPPQLKTRRNLSPVFRSFLQSCLKRNAKRRWTARKLLKHPFLKKSKSLDEMAPLIDAARRSTTQAPEPLLGPSLSGQEGKEEQAEKEVVKAKPEGMKSGTTAVPEPLLAPCLSGQEGKEEQVDDEPVAVVGAAEPEEIKSGTNVTPEPLLAPSLSGQEGKEEQVDNEPVAVVGATEPEEIKSGTTAVPEPLLAPCLSGQEGKEEQVDDEPVAVVGAAEPEEIKSDTTAAPEPLLAPSDSGQEVEEKEVEKEPVAVGKVKPEEIKPILKRPVAAAEPQPKKVTFANTEMPSTSTGKGDTRKKSIPKKRIPKKIPHQPPTLSPLTQLYLDDLKGIVSEGNPTKKYTLQQIIGQGTFGTVFRGVDIATGGQVAIKKIFVLDRKNKRELVVTEVAVLKSVRHPNIIRYIDSYLFNEELWLVMEYVEGCTLAAVVSIQALEEEMIASISRECLKALDFLHSNLVIHRDIKSDNILLGIDGSVKLIDFGLCAWLKPQRKTWRSFFAAPFYMASEMLRRDRYDAKVDIWALGITALEMVDGPTQDVPPQLETPRNPPSMFRSILQSYLYGNVRPQWPTRQLLQTKWLQHPVLEKSDSLTNNSPLLDAARRFLTERFTTPSTEPLLAPSVSGQESKEEQAEKENIRAKPEGMKSGTTAVPEPLLAPCLSGQEGKEEQVDDEPVAVVGAAEPEEIKSGTNVTPEPLLAPSLSGQEGKEEQVDNEPVAVVGATEPEEIKSGTTAAPEPLLAPCLSGQEGKEEQVDDEPVAVVGAAEPEEIKSDTTAAPEPLLAPSDSGQEVEEKEVEKEPVAVGKVKPEEIKPILKSSAMAGVAAAPQPKEDCLPDTEMPSTSTGKRGTGKKCTQKTNTGKKSSGETSTGRKSSDQPQLISSLTSIYLADLKGIVSEGNPAKKYTLQQIIGQGTFGTVFRGVDIATGGQVAIKKIFLGDQKHQSEKVVNEVTVLKRMRHPNIIHYIDSYLFNEELWLVMEYVEGCTLGDVISKQALEEEMIASISRECLKALDFLHSNRVIHRDIKSDNILLGIDGSVRLIDFGLCAWLKPRRKTWRSFFAAPFYMASEMLRGDRYDAKVDIWALGITALEMVDGPTRDVPPQLETPRNPPSMFRSILQSYLYGNVRPQWPTRQLLQTKWLQHPVLEKSDSLTNNSPLLDAARRFLTERFTTPSTEPLLAPSVSGQESKEEQAEKENIRAKPEGMKSGTTAVPEPLLAPCLSGQEGKEEQVDDEPVAVVGAAEPEEIKSGTNVTPEPLLAPSLSGQEGKEEQVDNEPVAVVGATEPEEIKSGTTAVPEPLLAPCLSGQEGKEEQVDDEPVAVVGAAEPEEIKSDTTAAPEPLLAPSDSGQEVEEKEVEKEPVAVGKVKPEEIKPILKSSAMAGVAAAPQPKEDCLPDTEMPSTSTGKRGTGKKCTQKTNTGKKSSGETSTGRKSSDQPQLISSLTSIYLADLKGIVSEENPAKKYTLQQIIGQGTFGTVFRGVDIATGGQVAIKKIFLGDQKHQSEKVVNEVTVLKRMRHPNIIHYIDSYLFNEELWLVMEYVEGCTLGDVISKQALEEEMIASISRECLKALDFLHSNRVIHRDIKSDNILLGIDGSVRLIDFGLCAWLKPRRKTWRSFFAAPFYMASEMLRGDRYDAKVDIWALGITALEMVDGPTRPKDVPPELETPRELSPVFRSFLQSCLNRKVKRRWTAKKLLKHPFLKKSKSLDEMAPLIDAARRSTTQAPEPLLGPSLSGQEGKEEQAEKEVVKAKP
ncbi:uncharacterized protein LOC127470375 [Manacus candei]|uniref:uncharacterized protein LOC127470375 n=1 Tax=Manacus candei TaxID=415023 RepID=UPI0022268C0B|nr:uncharacterized protein LOC127470375 [Manacus candei]